MNDYIPPIRNKCYFVKRPTSRYAHSGVQDLDFLPLMALRRHFFLPFSLREQLGTQGHRLSCLACVVSSTRVYRKFAGL